MINGGVVMTGSVVNLERSIASLIKILASLKHNFTFKTTGLGGLFLEYYSNNHGGVATMNSRVQFSINFNTTDNMGRYIGDNVGMEMHRYRNIKPIRSVKTKLPYQEVVGKLNRWIENNEGYLVKAIEY